MSGVASLVLRRDLIAHYFRGTALPYTQLQFALTRRIPPANAAANQLDEPVGLSYARVSTVFPSSVVWLGGPSDEMTLNVALLFPTATGTWGTINGWAMVSNGATPLVLATGQVPRPLRVISGIRPRLPIGAVSFSLLDT